jgi:AraC-like DNA-binding protein
MPVPESKGHLNPGDGGVVFDRFELGAGLADLVRHVWVVRWELPEGVRLPQRVLSYPAVNVVLQPGGAVLAGPDPALSVQTLERRGWAVGVLFRPAAAVLLHEGPAVELVGREVPFDGDATGRVVFCSVARRVAAALDGWRGGGAGVGADRDTGGGEQGAGNRAGGDGGDRAGGGEHGAGGRAGGGRSEIVAALRSWLLPLAAHVDDRGRLVNEVCRLAEEDDGILRAAQLAERAGLSPRTLERLLRERVGVAPKWLIECRRLQEAATRLHGHPSTPLSDLAAELGYADYSHFSRRYAAVLGETPEQTRRAGAASATA